jgi:hypothetical protein
MSELSFYRRLPSYHKKRKRLLGIPTSNNTEDYDGVEFKISHQEVSDYTYFIVKVEDNNYTVLNKFSGSKIYTGVTTYAVKVRLDSGDWIREPEKETKEEETNYNGVRFYNRGNFDIEAFKILGRNGHYTVVKRDSFVSSGFSDSLIKSRFQSGDWIVAPEEEE